VDRVLSREQGGGVDAQFIRQMQGWDTLSAATGIGTIGLPASPQEHLDMAQQETGHAVASPFNQYEPLSLTFCPLPITSHKYNIRRTKMKRQTLVEYKDASPEIQAIYDEVMEVTGSPDVFNFLKAFGNNEKALRAFWSMLRYTLLEGDVPALLKQLILFRVSVEYGNTYCASLHGQTVLRIDPTITYDELMAMSDGGNMDIPASYVTAIELVTQMALRPKTVEAEDFDFEEQLRDEGFSEQEIDELISVAGFGVLLNTMTDIVHIPAEKPLDPAT
jgi:alkylhydroperoxidase family enzyme